MLRFWSYLAFGFALTALVVGGVGGLAWRFLVPPPPLPRFIIGPFEFALAPGWNCDLDGTEYVCESGPPPRSAIAIFALKLRGPQDKMQAFEDHLRHPKQPPKGSSRLPVVLRVPPHRIRLAGHDWIEAVQVNSELQNYVTTYLATVTSYVGILITFSAYAPREAEFRPAFEKMKDSLVIHQR